MGTNESEDEAEKSYKVVDKRRFDDQGKSKTGGSADKEVASKGSANTGRGEAIQKPDLGSKGPANIELTFSSFIMSLATQALAQLGEIKIPGAEDIPKDLDAAKQSIDIIEMLKSKTKGNLDSNEDHLIGEILHTLRMSFVRVTKGENIST